MTRNAFVCVGNASRSQTATAFAEEEQKRRIPDDTIRIVTGGIEPHVHVHGDVVAVPKEEEIDTSDTGEQDRDFCRQGRKQPEGE